MCSPVPNANQHAHPVCGVNISLLPNLAAEDEEFEESIVSQISLIQMEIEKIIKTLKKTKKDNPDQIDPLKNQFSQFLEVQLDTYIAIRNASKCGQRAMEKIKDLEISLDDACFAMKEAKGQSRLKDLFIPREDIYHLKETLKSKDNH